jgi:hypothetical protein
MTDLDRLIRQQRKDARGQHRHSSTREVMATDLGDRDEGWAILAGQADRPRRREDNTGETIYLMGCRAWEAWEDREPAAVLAKADAAEERGESVTLGPCAVCRGRDLAADRHCLRCNRDGRDGTRHKFRGRPVGEVCRRDYLPPDDGLKGGVG